jgi:hypothetical protein
MGWKIEGGEKDVSPSPSKSNQTWNLPLATKLGSSFAFFLPLFFKGVNLDHLFLFFWM